MMKSIWVFEEVNLFKLLCPHKFKAYKKSHEFSAYKKQDYIYFTEDAANKVYLIEKGRVKIGYYKEDGTEVVKAILDRGEMFGENAILGNKRREEFAQSIDNATSICPVSVKVLQDLMRDNHTLSLRIYKFIGLKLKRLERRLQILLFKDSKTRLLEFLDELCKEYAYECNKTGDQVIKHPYTQGDIASLIGVSRPTLNILLNELKAENMLTFSRKEIRLLANHVV